MTLVELTNPSFLNSVFEFDIQFTWSNYYIFPDQNYVKTLIETFVINVLVSINEISFSHYK
jgi:hypothetical protein